MMGQLLGSSESYLKVMIQRKYLKLTNSSKVEVQAVYSTAGHGLKISLAPHLDLLMRAHLIDNYTLVVISNIHKTTIRPKLN